MNIQLSRPTQRLAQVISFSKYTQALTVRMQKSDVKTDKLRTEI